MKGEIGSFYKVNYPKRFGSAEGVIHRAGKNIMLNAASAEYNYVTPHSFSNLDFL